MRPGTTISDTELPAAADGDTITITNTATCPDPEASI